MRPIFVRSPADFGALIQVGVTCESNVLDFKAKIDTKGDAKNGMETCRDIAQFANTLGGCLLIGVSEGRNPVTGLKVAGPIVPISDADELRGWIEQQIANHLVPSTLTHDVVPITLPDGTILGVNIEASRNLITVWDREKHTCEFLRRTSHGKHYMNPDEMERHIMDGSRVGKLALLQALDRCGKKSVRIAGGLWMRFMSPKSDQPWTSKSVQLGDIEDYYSQLLVDSGKSKILRVTIPFDAIRSAWPTDQYVNLFLGMRIVVTDKGDEILLDPPV